jgi:hypothetical protein
MKKTEYWGYRIDTSKIKFFQQELENGRLRQGWGWDNKQNLQNLTLDEGAKRNLPMFNKVKKDDYILIPRLPSWSYVTIAQATEDWEKGYKFKIYDKYNDYGHIFPAKICNYFTRNNKYVTGNIRSTLKNPSRFWNIKHCSNDIEKILEQPNKKLLPKQEYEERFIDSIDNIFNKVFDESKFKNKIFDKFNEQFSDAEWEHVLEKGLKKILPFYHIERVGGKNEKNHGTDIIIRIPSILSDYKYGIAIQVKDYNGNVSDDVINQINKAEKYWQENENLKLIDKIVIFTNADKTNNIGLLNNDSGVKFIFLNEFKEVLNQIAKSFINLNNY